MLYMVWIYLIMFTVSTMSVPMGKSRAKNKSLWIGQRRNSKMSKDFPITKSFGKKIPQWDKFVRQLKHQTNITEDSNEIPDDMDTKIVNGRPANDREFPWMVALHFNGRFICSSFLISPNLVMTAAHCVQFENDVEPASAFHGIVGNIRREGPETRLEFSEVAAHPNYGSGSENDIAVLRIASSVEMTDRIQAICLPTPGREFDLVYLQAMGWGAQSSEMPEAPEILMTTELGVPPKTLCQFFFSFLVISITERHICANSFKPTGVCFGDSGGPGVYDDPQSGRPVAIGIASFITLLGCGRPILPSVYTRIATYIDWLTETVGDTNDICFA